MLMTGEGPEKTTGPSWRTTEEGALSAIERQCQAVFLGAHPAWASPNARPRRQRPRNPHPEKDLPRSTFLAEAGAHLGCAPWGLGAPQLSNGLGRVGCATLRPGTFCQFCQCPPSGCHKMLVRTVRLSHHIELQVDTPMRRGMCLALPCTSP